MSTSTYTRNVHVAQSDVTVLGSCLLYVQPIILLHLTPSAAFSLTPTNFLPSSTAPPFFTLPSGLHYLLLRDSLQSYNQKNFQF